jgi:hypothetical protein
MAAAGGSHACQGSLRYASSGKLDLADEAAEVLSSRGRACLVDLSTRSGVGCLNGDGCPLTGKHLMSDIGASTTWSGQEACPHTHEQSAQTYNPGHGGAGHPQ